MINNPQILSPPKLQTCADYHKWHQFITSQSLRTLIWLEHPLMGGEGGGVGVKGQLFSTPPLLPSPPPHRQ